MTPDEKQLERLAQWLDGQKVVLSDQEMAWGQEFCADEQEIAGQLDVQAPAEVMARVRQLMLAAAAQESAQQVQTQTVSETKSEPQSVKPAAEVAILQPVAAQPQRVIRLNFRRLTFGVAAAAAIVLAVVIGWNVFDTQQTPSTMANRPPILSASEVDFPLTPYVSAEDKIFDRLAREIDSTEKTLDSPLTKSPACDTDGPSVPTVWPDEPGKPPRS